MSQAEVDLKLLNVGQVADLPGIHRTTLSKMMRAGRFVKPVMLNGGKRWTVQDIRDWMSSQRSPE